MFEFTIKHKLNGTQARTGIFKTPHGELHTPELAIVATEGEVKSVPAETTSKLPIKYSIVNTFHIFTKQILSKIEAVSGIHPFSKLPGVISSDSGGFQVFSLGFGKAHGVGKVAKIFPGEGEKQDIKRNQDSENPITINDEGVTFTFNDQTVTLTPEISMDIQHKIGADIIFAFDECTSPLNSKEYTREALLKRTHKWIERCVIAHEPFKETQALFAIVQGGAYQDLREMSAKHMAIQDVPGYGIGGSLGSTKEDMYNILSWTIPLLPENKPKHLLGIGQVRDIFESVERGIDLFDCVIPTREARHKVLYTHQGKKTVRKTTAQPVVIDGHCHCQACREGVTWEQLADLFSKKDGRAYFYATVHNIQFFTDLMAKIRIAIEADTFAELKADYYNYY